MFPKLSVPDTVMVYVPKGVVLEVRIVIVEEDPAFTDVGLKVAVIPVGSPDAERAIVPL